MSSMQGGNTTPPPWIIARFHDCVFDRQRRELSKAGERQLIGRWAFDALVYLIDNRDRVVTKSELAVISGRVEIAGDGAVARGVMKIRKAIGDDRRDTPMVRTEHGVGYRFMAEVRLGSETAAEPQEHAARAEEGKLERRVVVLPFQNDTLDPRLSWVPLGIISMLEAALKLTPGWSIVPLPDTLAALADGWEPASGGHRNGAIGAALGAKSVIVGRLSGWPGRYLLEFRLDSVEQGSRHGALIGIDPARMATDAAHHLRRWMSAAYIGPEDVALDTQDQLYGSAFAAALQRSRQCRYVEADHLLDVAAEAELANPMLHYERAKIRVMLGRPDAVEQIESLKGAARQQKDDRLLAQAHGLLGVYLEQCGLPEQAAASMLSASEANGASGCDNLAVNCMLEYAQCMGDTFGSHALPALSQASARAERLGDRILLSRAYWVAGKLAGLANDWNAAIHHHGLAASIVRDMEGPAQVALNTLYAWTRAQLGQLSSAVDAASSALADAQISGKQPEMGLAAGVTAYLYFADRRIGKLARLYSTIRELGSGSTASLTLARDAHCAASLLCSVSDFDRALERVNAAREAVACNPFLIGSCEQIRLRILLRARRFEESRQACEQIMSSISAGRCDPRARLWAERAMAMRECFGEGRVDSALARLHALARGNPICEAQAIASLEAAWIHLERNELNVAKQLVAPLSVWLEQTPSGMQVDARMHFAEGNARRAAQIQQQFLARYAECTTDTQRLMLDVYKGRPSKGAPRLVPTLNESLDVHISVSPTVLKEVWASVD